MIKIPTGVTGLDEMLVGGLPKGRVFLICGGPGTGKTILALQYISAAIDRGESAVYVTLEEPLSFIRENTNSFGWKLREKELTKQLKLLDFYTVPFGVESLELRDREGRDPSASILRDVINAVKAIRADHVVIDPLTSVVIHEQRSGIKRYRIGEIFSEMRKLGCTSVFTSEITSLGSEFYMEEFLADGVIQLDKTIHDFNLIKTLRIVKMRGVNYDEQPRRYMIGERGFMVYNTEPVRV